MILEGFKCDECDATSTEKPGDWHQVQAGKVQPCHGFGPGFVFNRWSAGLQFCSKECLIANASKWKTR